MTAATMSLKNSASRRIEQPAAAQYLLPDPRLEATFWDQIHAPAEEGGEPILQGQQGHESNSGVRFELHQQIDVAVCAEIRA